MANTSRRVSVTNATFAQLEAVANERLIGVNAIVEKAVESYLKLLEQQPKLP
jgi:hypothetical protein